MNKEQVLSETQKKFLMEIKNLPDEAIMHLLNLVKIIKEVLQIEESDDDKSPGKKRNIPGDILNAVQAPPHLNSQDIEELRKLIKEGRQSAHFKDPFSN